MKYVKHNGKLTFLTGQVLGIPNDINADATPLESEASSLHISLDPLVIRFPFFRIVYLACSNIQWLSGFFYCLIDNFFYQFASIFSLNIHETHRSCFKTNRFSASFDNDFAFVTQWHCNITIDFDDLFVARTTIFNLNYFCLVSILHF